jgi:hypothetical protein
LNIPENGIIIKAVMTFCNSFQIVPLYIDAAFLHRGMMDGMKEGKGKRM